MTFVISPWEAISRNYGCTILLGNGASIAVSPSFSYGSLLRYAVEQRFLPEDAQRLFQFFQTNDFELVLRIVWQASNVNRSLQIQDHRTHAAYLSLRDCLIQTVRDIHPEYDQVSPHLAKHLSVPEALPNRYLTQLRLGGVLGHDLRPGH